MDVSHVVARLGDTSGDHPLNAVSELQHGLVDAEQLRLLDIPTRTASDRAGRGRLFRVHRGVYAVGRSEISDRGRMLAAVLAIGPGSSLIARSALSLWGVLPVDRTNQHVTNPDRRRRRAGMTLHQAAPALNDCAAIARIPLTAPARSLLDFAAGADPGELETALNELRAQRLLGPGDLDALRARTRGHHGWGPLGRILDAELEPDFSRREAERRLLGLIREAHLPEPRRNVKVGGYEVDLHWPEQRLVVEVDSYAFHGNRPAFERDRRKQADLTGLGLEVLRFTWRQIADERVWLIARIAGRLAARGRVG